MQQLKKLSQSFSRRQRIGIAAAAAITLVAVGSMGWYASNNFKPLYTSLSQQDAGAVVQKLKQSGVEYRLADNGATVLVPENAVAESRLEMALAGLPKTGRIGFELFDRTNLGVTQFAEHINYQRALEGELERSVMSLAEVEGARVHLTFAKDSVFTESREPAKASVLLKLRPGSQIAPRNVVAISHLVAAAVEGLTPPSVSILDMNGNLLSRPNRNPVLDGTQASDSLVEYQQSLEKSLVAKISATLEPLLGHDKYRAGVSVDCDFTSGEQSEESFDPVETVIVTSQRTEETSGGANGASGIPGTASSLPRPNSTAVPSSPGVSRKTENVAYQTSRTVKRTKIPQGTVKKISAAVLADYAVRWEGEGDDRKRIVEPLPAEKLEVIRELVAAAIGLNPERGDQLTVHTLPFESTLQTNFPEIETVPATPGEGDAEGPLMERLQRQIWERFQQDPAVVIGTALGGFLLLVLAAWFVRRSLKRRQRARAEESHGALSAASESGVHEVESREGSADIESAAEAPALASSRQHALFLAVQEIVKKDTELSAGIVQAWLVEEGRR